MYGIYFIHSSVNGHLSCFYDTAIVNSAAVNTGVHASFEQNEFYIIESKVNSRKPVLCLRISKDFVFPFIAYFAPAQQIPSFNSN